MEVNRIEYALILNQIKENKANSDLINEIGFALISLIFLSTNSSSKPLTFAVSFNQEISASFIVFSDNASFNPSSIKDFEIL